MSGAAIELVEVSPRDGLQNERAPVSTAAKVELIRRLARAGAARIEAVSFVSPKATPQMADAEAVLERLRDEDTLDGIRLSGLVLNRRGFDRAMAAEIEEINFAVMASETFNRRNQGAAVSEVVSDIAAVAPLARAAGRSLAVTIGVAFGCPFEGEVPLARIVALSRDFAGLGIGEIALADTIGVGDPVAVEQRLKAVRAAAPRARIRCHFHNTRNTGLANAYAAWRAGASVLDASLGGAGGCPFAPGATGNIPTEDAVYMLHRMGLETGYSLPELLDASAWLGRLLERSLPSLLPKAGGFPRASSGAEVA
jgi:hydroxymethylglutaryl-CoA lyase